MAERMTLEERIQSYIDQFISEWVEYDEEFVIQQVKEQYPWTPIDNSKWWRLVSYHKIYATKAHQDTELWLKIP